MAAGLTSPVSSDMDDSWTESKPKRGQGRMGAGLVMTPSDSQEIPVSSFQPAWLANPGPGLTFADMPSTVGST